MLEPSYNLLWTSPSHDSSQSMPCGGGDIGLNLWVEGDDLLFYFCRSGNFDENGTLLKNGRVRLRLDPNPFGVDFRQELDLSGGCVNIQAGSGDRRVSIRIWVDVFRPVIHLELESLVPVEAEVSFESWRYEDRLLKEGEKSQCNSFNGYPGDIFTFRDTIEPREDGILFFHRNRSDALLFDFILRQQKLGKGDGLWNPQKDLTFGGLLRGDGLTYSGTTSGDYCGLAFKGWQLKSAHPSRSLNLELVLHNEQSAEPGMWEEHLQEALQSAHAAIGAREETLEWWRAFWARSRIVIEPGVHESRPWQVGRNYQLARYMLGCNARGEFAQKFNGGLFTFDPVHINPEWAGFTPDFRLWGGSVYTAQNQRLLFWPMLKSGDFELPIQEFERYRRSLPAAEHRSRVYWGHEGASFTEQIELFGLPAAAMWGFEESTSPRRVRPADLPEGALSSPWVRFYYATQLEFSWMILEWHRFTGGDISDYLPFIESSLRFYEEHYGKEPGPLRITPSQSIEMYFEALNPCVDLAGLRSVLTALPGLSLSPGKKEKWEELLARIPALPLEKRAGKEVLAPAEKYDATQQNSEIPELYSVFPYSFYGVGHAGLQLARDTWQHGASNNLRAFVECWSQVAIFAARLGLVEEAAELIQQKLGDSPRRCPAFWGPGPDHVPDIDHGGSGMIALQEMLLQTPGDKLLLLPAWPKNWDVDFTLHAPKETVISTSVRAGSIVKLEVTPAARMADVSTSFPISLPAEKNVLAAL